MSKLLDGSALVSKRESVPQIRAAAIQISWKSPIICYSLKEKLKFYPYFSISAYAQPELYVCKGSEEHGEIQNLPSYEVLTVNLC